MEIRETTSDGTLLNTTKIDFNSIGIGLIADSTDIFGGDKSEGRLKVSEIYNGRGDESRC